MEDDKKIVNIIMKSILLFPILTIVQGISFLGFINKVWMGVVLLELIFSFKFLKYRKMDFAILLITSFIHIIAFINTKGKIYNINMIFYLFVWVLFYLFVAMQKKLIISFFEDNKDFLLNILRIWTFIVGISIFIPSCYDKTGSFISFGDTSFRLMPTVLIITSLAIYLKYTTDRKIYNLYLLIPIYAAFMGYSRTYFGVFLIFLLIDFYMCSKSKISFIITLIPIIVLIVLAISFTNIGDKIESTSYTKSSYLDFWGTITSGRSVFWKIDLDEFNKLSFIKRLVGNGYNFVYDVNLSIHGRKIWAHNDFINLLLNFGYLGVIVYIYSFYRMTGSLINGSQLSKVVVILLLLAIIINSFFNMSYTYLCATISYPLFIIAFLKKNNKKGRG